ncbi:MAG TPA: type II toxin-antitoxin system VapC family toxin [Asticcacaulis sp.]|nr:type II toxin-antitoxin system VapC family toxin [Asticcacaulis sp.]
MIVLDTNVVSEAMKPEPAHAVLNWLDAQVAETLYISSVTVAELLFGVGVLPDGRRKQQLAKALEGVFNLFEGRILPFDLDAAQRYADLAVAARNAGQGFPAPNGYIAAIASARSFTVASRDASAFKAAGLGVIDPWRM